MNTEWQELKDLVRKGKAGTDCPDRCTPSTGILRDLGKINKISEKKEDLKKAPTTFICPLQAAIYSLLILYSL